MVTAHLKKAGMVTKKSFKSSAVLRWGKVQQSVKKKWNIQSNVLKCKINVKL